MGEKKKKEKKTLRVTTLDLAFHMSNIIDTGLDRHTLSVLIALCDLGLNPESLAAAVVKELRTEPPPPQPQQHLLLCRFFPEQ
ncbi:hypothetical protein CMV_030085, partial [Castanea mollissima]